MTAFLQSRGIGLVLLLLLVGVVGHSHSHHHLDDQADDQGVDYECGTMLVAKWKPPVPIHNHTAGRIASGCAQLGPCDNPGTRQATATGDKTIRVVWHIAASSGGQAPDGFTTDDVAKQMQHLNAAFNPYQIYFNSTGAIVHNNDAYYCLPPVSSTDRTWLNKMIAMKREFSSFPETTLNIYVSCMKKEGINSLSGLSTFPWEADSMKPTGGLWINSAVVNAAALKARNPTLVHEMGHLLGLWHTFRGVSENDSGCSDPCYEDAHQEKDLSYDLVGDFCADTPATPKNPQCARPSGKSCGGWLWGLTDFTNYMGVSQLPHPCTNHFSSCQKQRMHCWVCDRLRPIVTAGC